MKRFRYGRKSIAFLLWNWAPHRFVWRGQALCPEERLAAPWVDVTHSDVITPLVQIGDEILRGQIPAAVWRRDVAELATEVGSITRMHLTWDPEIVDIERQPPTQGRDSLWQWAGLGAHVAAAIEALGVVVEEGLDALRDHVADRHAMFRADFPDNHPMHTARTGLPSNPWTHMLPLLGLARHHPLDSAVTSSEDLIREFYRLRRGDVESQLARIRRIRSSPDEPPVYAGTAVTLASVQVMWAYGDPGRLRACNHCGRTYFRHDKRQLYCSSRCNDAAYKERKASRA